MYRFFWGSVYFKMRIILIYYNLGPVHNIWRFYAAFVRFFVFCLFVFFLVEIKFVPGLFGTELRRWSLIKDVA